MRVTLKLYATLSDYLPAGARARNELPLEVADDATLESVVSPFRLPPKLVHLVLVNGAYVAPEARRTHALQEGDTLAIWPPIAGG